MINRRFIKLTPERVKALIEAERIAQEPLFPGLDPFQNFPIRRLQDENFTGYCGDFMLLGGMRSGADN